MAKAPPTSDGEALLRLYDTVGGWDKEGTLPEGFMDSLRKSEATFKRSKLLFDTMMLPAVYFASSFMLKRCECHDAAVPTAGAVTHCASFCPSLCRSLQL